MQEVPRRGLGWGLRRGVGVLRWGLVGVRCGDGVVVGCVYYLECECVGVGVGGGGFSCERGGGRGGERGSFVGGVGGGGSVRGRGGGGGGGLGGGGGWGWCFFGSTCWLVFEIGASTVLLRGVIVFENPRPVKHRELHRPGQDRTNFLLVRPLAQYSG